MAPTMAMMEGAQTCRQRIDREPSELGLHTVKRSPKHCATESLWNGFSAPGLNSPARMLVTEAHILRGLEKQ
jgi:hypothetical protein